MAASLPDEVWRKILDMGLQNSKFSYRDLCRISIASRCLNRLSNEDTLWTALLNLDYPLTSTSALPPSNIKTLYKSRFERDKQRRLAAHKRALLRSQSQVSLHSINLKHLRLKLMEETQLMKAKAQELSNLHNQRRASVAMKVWQPEIVRDRQKRMVEQSVVPVEFRISSVEMELRLCRQQIEVFNKSLSDEENRLNAAKKQLAMLKYHPFQDDHSAGTGVNKRSIELKKLKQCSKRAISGKAMQFSTATTSSRMHRRPSGGTTFAEEVVVTQGAGGRKHSHLRIELNGYEKLARCLLVVNLAYQARQ